MVRIWLDFSSFPDVQLLETKFENGSQCFNAKRGNLYINSFHWSSGVKALSLLFLKFKLGENGISGLGGSLAGSLDYALSKQPQWLIDIFGVSHSGDAFARRLFSRINPERKRAGPVEIFINKNIITPANIKVSIAGQEVDLAVCRRLINGFEEKLINSKITNNLSKLKPIFNHEINYSLSSDDIFSAYGIKKCLTRIRENSIFNKHVKASTNLFYESSYINSGTARFGICDDKKLQAKILSEKPISVYCTHALPGVHAIFEYLERKYSYNIRNNFNIGSSIDTVKAIFNNTYLSPPDVVVVGLAASALLMSQKTDYIPLMLAPRGSHRIVGSSKYQEETRLTGELGLMHDEAASALYHLNDLRTKKLLKRNVKVANVGLAQSFERLKSGDPDFSALLVFPHYSFNSLFNESKILDLSNYLNNKESLFFVSKEFASDSFRLRSLTLAIREAWRVLSSNSEIRNYTTSSLLNDANYQEILATHTGIH